MSYSKAEIDAFMELGKPKEKFFLNWFGKESFCDDGVQKVLLGLHPDKIKYPEDSFKAYPVDAWSIADSFSLSKSEANWIQLLPFVQQNLIWTTELLASIVHYRESAAEKYLRPVTALDELEQWRGDRFLRETAPIQHTHEEAVRHNTLLKHTSLEGNNRRRVRGASPPPIEEAPKPLTDKTGRMDGKGKLSAGAYRSAAREENARRDGIMRHWAECWLAHFRR